MNVTPVESWLPWEIWDKITLSLEPKDAFILSSVTSAFRKRFLSDEVQKTLIDWHFHCSLDPSTTPQEQYLRLCSRALGSVFPILKSKIPLGESRLNQY